MKTITELLSKHVGRRVSCTIGRSIIKDCKVQKQGHRFFLCQDVCAGSSCKDKLGYKYSWVIGDGTEGQWVSNDVKELELKSNTESTITRGDVYEGDVIISPDDDDAAEYEVVGVAGSVVFYLSGTGVLRHTTEARLISKGFTFKVDIEE